ncbi:hypothetical protein [Bradyrhizobium sp.]|uniref:hypothetical protein n=1 Tax=Bradyrhizobium sp. TaxID=376 RepID=UPI003BB1401C
MRDGDADVDATKRFNDEFNGVGDERCRIGPVRRWRCIRSARRQVSGWLRKPLGGWCFIHAPKTSSLIAALRDADILSRSRTTETALLQGENNFSQNQFLSGFGAEGGFA